MGRVAEMAWEQQQAQQALDLAEMERDRYREMRRKVLEEAAGAAAGFDPDRRHIDPVAIAYMQGRRDAVSDIRALADRDPPEPLPWRDSLGPEDRYESNKGPANG